MIERSVISSINLTTAMGRTFYVPDLFSSPKNQAHDPKRTRGSGYAEKRGGHYDRFVQRRRTRGTTFNQFLEYELGTNRQTLTQFNYLNSPLAKTARIVARTVLAE
jgi:hypothetical protein